MRLSLPPLVRTAVAAAERHSPMDTAGHAPSICRHLPLCGEHLESPCASVFGGSGAEKEAPRGGGSGTGATTAPAPQDSFPPPPSPRRPQPVLFGDVSSPPPTPFTSAPPFIRLLPACTRHKLSLRPWLSLFTANPGTRLPLQVGCSLPTKATGLLRLIFGNRKHLCSVSLSP